MLDPRNGGPNPQPLEHGTGEQVTRAFDPKWIIDAITSWSR
jgi:hypothetical protein